MAYLQFDGTAILGVAGAVPRKIFNNLTDSSFFSPDEAREIVERTGVLQRRLAPPEICASDLCQAAAEKLLGEMGIERSQIDVLIVNTQTPDYKTPGTSNVLQHKLGFAKSCATYDINLGPPGFLLGLSLGFSLLQSKNVRHVLLLCGETASKAYSFKDRTTGLVFGDAGTACLLGKSETAERSHFLFSTNAGQNASVMIPAGGYRNPSSLESLREKNYPDGSVRSDEQCHVDIEALQRYVQTAVQPQIMSLFDAAGMQADEVSRIIPHAFDKKTNDLIVNSAGFPAEKALNAVERFGDTGSAAFVLSLLKDIGMGRTEKQVVMLCAAGAGLSLASALVVLENTYRSELMEI